MNMLLSADAYVSPSTLLSSFHTPRKRWFPVGVQGIVVNFGVDIFRVNEKAIDIE